MYIKLYESEKKILKEIEELLITDYNINDFTEADKMLVMLEDLKTEYDRLKEEYEDYKENIQENYIQKENKYE